MISRGVEIRIGTLESYVVVPHQRFKLTTSYPTFQSSRQSAPLRLHVHKSRSTIGGHSSHPTCLSPRVDFWPPRQVCGACQAGNPSRCNQSHSTMSSNRFLTRQPKRDATTLRSRKWREEEATIAHGRIRRKVDYTAGGGGGDDDHDDNDYRSDAK